MPKASKKYSLYLVKPSLVMEWHPTKNKPLRPRDVTPGSGKKVWWLCDKGHEWQAAIYSRSGGSGCPHCRNGLTLENDQPLVMDLSLKKQWHPTKNVNLNPLYIDSSYPKKVWWVCQDGYEWLATIKSRLNGAGCPRCAENSTPKKSLGAKTDNRSDSITNEDSLQPSEHIPIMGPSIESGSGYRDFRTEKRYGYSDMLILENQDSGQWIYARSANISSKGLFIEADSPFNTGTNLLVKFRNPPFKSMQKTFPSKVRWCKHMGHESKASFYTMGVTFT